MNGEGDVNLSTQLANVRYLFQVVLIPLVVSLGTPANLINVVVLIRMRTATTHYLATLAVYDLLYLAISLLLTPRARITHVHDTLMRKEWFLDVLTWLIPSAMVVSNAATWLICAFSAERCDGLDIY